MNVGTYVSPMECQTLWLCQNHISFSFESESKCPPVNASSPLNVGMGHVRSKRRDAPHLLGSGPPSRAVTARWPQGYRDPRARKVCLDGSENQREFHQLAKDSPNAGMVDHFQRILSSVNLRHLGIGHVFNLKPPI